MGHGSHHFLMSESKCAFLIYITFLAKICFSNFSDQWVGHDGCVWEGGTVSVKRKNFTCTSIHCTFGKVSLTSFELFLLMSFYNCLLCHCPHPNYILLGLLQWPLNSFQNWDPLTSKVFRKNDVSPHCSPCLTLFIASFSCLLTDYLSPFSYL